MPSPGIVTTPSASHVDVPGVNRHVADVLNAGPPVVAKPPLPVTVVKDTEPPGTTIFSSGAAAGAGGGVTVGVIVDAVV